MSACIALAFGLALAHRLCPMSRADRFWVAVAACSGHVYVLLTLLSIPRALRPVPFLIGQSALLGLALWWCGFGWVPRWRIPNLRRGLALVRSDVPTLIAVTIAACLLALSFVHRVLTPVTSFDARCYHASRVCYWVQNASMGYFHTNAFHHNAYSAGAGAIFLWPMVFTRFEFLARLVFWTAVPLLTFGLYTGSRALGISRRVSLLAPAAFLATPLVFEQTVILKPEGWLSLYGVGSIYWLVRGSSRHRRSLKALFWFGWFAVLCANVKYSFLPAVVGAPLLLALIFVWRRTFSLRGCVCCVAGMCICLCVSGLAYRIAINLEHYAWPLGPRLALRMHKPALSPYQIYVHAARTTATLAELPFAPWIHPWLTKAGNKALTFVRATKLLPEEGRDAPLGMFRYGHGALAHRFGIVGLLWLPALAYGLIWSLWRKLRSGWAGAGPTGAIALFVCACYCLGVLLPIMLLVKWQVNARVPMRFFIPVLLMSVPVLMSLVQRSRPLLWVLILSLTVQGVAQGSIVAARVAKRVRLGFSAAFFHNGGWEEVCSLLAPGSVVLVAGNWAGGQEYALFGHRMARRLVPWGARPFTSEAFDGLVAHERVSHALLLWGDGPEGAVPDVLAKHLAQRAEWEEVELDKERAVYHGARFFARGAAVAARNRRIGARVHDRVD